MGNELDTAPVASRIRRAWTLGLALFSALALGASPSTNSTSSEHAVSPVVTKERTPEAYRFSTEIARFTLAGAKFRVPMNEISGGLPQYQDEAAEHLLLGLYLDGGEVRGIRRDPLDDHRSEILVKITPATDGSSFGTDPPDRQIGAITSGGGKKSPWSGPQIRADLGYSEFVFEPNPTVRAYAMMSIEDRDPDGTMPATDCVQGTCRVQGLRFDRRLSYSYSFSQAQIGEWRKIHRAIRKHIEKLQTV